MAVIGQIPEGALPAFLALAEALADFGPVACQTSPDPDAWWVPDPSRGERPAAALASCRVCPAQPECLDYALAADEQAGLWGATTPVQRRQLLVGRANYLTVVTDQKIAS